MTLIEQKKELIKAIKEVTGVDLKTKTRKYRFIEARMLYYKILRDNGFTLSEIGNTLNKNHATVLHSLNTFDTIISIDKDLKDKYKMVKRLIEPEKINKVVLEEEVKTLREELRRYTQFQCLNKLMLLLEYDNEFETRVENFIHRARYEFK